MHRVHVRPDGKHSKLTANQDCVKFTVPTSRFISCAPMLGTVSTKGIRQRWGRLALRGVVRVQPVGDTESQSPAVFFSAVVVRGDLEVSRVLGD
jgi:hypothetical protein